MNSIRPVISYAELLAAKQFNNLLLDELRNDLIIEQMKKPIRKKILKQKENNVNFALEIQHNINKVFVNQVTQIEFQMDINYPQL